ncbi:MAG TPA: hypothetical protein VEA37_02060 [Flavobacterium sp.]|nr:hypothetical protein [Flavobacterium sp.]
MHAAPFTPVAALVFLILLAIAAFIDGKRTRHMQEAKFKSYPKANPICKRKKS